MTLAIDKRTDEVIGQVVTCGYDCTPDGRAIGGLLVRLLTRDGYRNVDAASVRLERMED